MSDIDDERAAAQALAPIPARETGVYQTEIGVAQLMAKSNFLPKHLHGNPGNCLALIMLSRDWNLNPIAVGFKTSIVNDKLMFEGQLVNAVIAKSKVVEGRLRFELTGEGETTSCTAIGRIRGEADERKITVGMPKTRNSPLWKGNQGDIEQQITYLASRVWCRRHAPEILLGVYTPEDDWSEREPDEHNERRAASMSRVAVLESKPAQELPSGQDDFIGSYIMNDRTEEDKAFLAGAPAKREYVVEVVATAQKYKPGELAQDDLDEPIPDFTKGK